VASGLMIEKVRVTAMGEAPELLLSAMRAPLAALLLHCKDRAPDA